MCPKATICPKASTTSVKSRIVFEALLTSTVELAEANPFKMDCSSYKFMVL